MLKRPDLGPAKLRPNLDAAASRREAHRQRQARHRARVRAGVMTAIIEVDEVGVSWLITHARALDGHALDCASRREARALIGEAVSELIRVSSRAAARR